MRAGIKMSREGVEEARGWGGAGKKDVQEEMEGGEEVWVMKMQGGGGGEAGRKRGMDTNSLQDRLCGGNLRDEDRRGVGQHDGKWLNYAKKTIRITSWHNNGFHCGSFAYMMELTAWVSVGAKSEQCSLAVYTLIIKLSIIESPACWGHSQSRICLTGPTWGLTLN